MGFMGAGKTTVGQILAEELGWQFLDLDHQIEQEAASTVSQLFAKGEEHFRAIESKVLARVLTQEPLVLATGGGVVAEPKNLELLLSRAKVVYLKVPLEVLWQRTGGEEGAGVRPLLAGGFAQFSHRFATREESYLKAQLVVDATGEPHEVAQQIIASMEGWQWT